jgi:N-acetylglucosamine-6-phosphate deacetylase
MSDRVLTLCHGQVLLADGAWHDTDLTLADGRIAAIGGPQLGQAWDVQGACVLPGLIDLHTHGIGLEAVESAGLGSYARLEAAHGATCFFPTLFAAPEKSAALMERHRRDTDELCGLPQIGGFRLESPYLAHIGAGVTRDLAPISPQTTESLLEAGGGHVKIWDVSPELPGAPELIRDLTARGIVCSLAHTQATMEQARAAVDAGARLVTHLFDTFVPPVMADPGVYPAGLVDYLLVEDRLMVEIIADGMHVAPLLVEKSFRCKPPDRLAFVTDSNLGAGAPPGKYDLPQGWGRVVVSGPNDGVRLIDRGMSLAGSALTPLDALRNAVRLFGKDWATASRVCSLNPARLLGLNKGEIVVGRDADLIVLDERLELLATVVAGQVVYTRGPGGASARP